MPKPIFSFVEPLEQRIAPATVVLDSFNESTRSFDHTKTVTITSSVGTTRDLLSLFTIVTPIYADTDPQRTADYFFIGSHLDLSFTYTGHAKFAHSDLTITVAGGATFSLPALDATGMDLGTVTVRGELGKLLIGDRNLNTPALKKLDIDEFGTTHQDASVVHGSITTLNVTDTLAGTLTLETKAGSIGTATIGGELAGDFGNQGDSAGSIFAGGSIGTLTVSGGLDGGEGAKSGSVFVGGSIGHVTLASVHGGTGASSGSLHADGNLPDVKVTGDISASSNQSATSNGSITAFGKITSITVTGTVTGGAADSSGQIAAGAGIGTAVLTGGLAGGDGLESGSIGAFGPLGSITLGASGGTTDIMTGGLGTKSGSILGSTSISSVIVNGNIIGGDGPNSAEIASAGTLGTVVVHGRLDGGSESAGSGAIGSKGALGDVTVDGAVTGGSANSSGQIVSATSIHSVTVHGALQGGFGTESGAIGSLGPIGAVTVDGDVRGQDAFHSGSILTLSTLGKVTLGGSLIGTNSAELGSADALVFAGVSIGSITVAHDVQGGNTFLSGVIEAGALPSVTIHGSIIGGSGDNTGGVLGQFSIGKVTVDGDILAGLGFESGVVSSHASIGSVAVHGSLDGTSSGSSGQYSGCILALNPEVNARVHATAPVPHNIGTVTIDGSILGGSAFGAGGIFAQGNISSVTVGVPLVAFASPAGSGASGSLEPVVMPFLFKAISGDIIGGSNSYTGVIFANGNIASVKAYGSMEGSGGGYSGGIHSQSGTVGSVNIALDVTGGAGGHSGSIDGAAIGTVTIGGDLTGGQSDHAGSIVATGADIRQVTVGGTIGVAASSTNGTGSTYISAQRNLGSLHAGSIVGREFATETSTGSGTAFVDVFISAGGNLQARSAAQALAIGSVTVDQVMSQTTIEAGYDHLLNQVNGHVIIGTIEVGKNAPGDSTVWTDNDVIAGATGATFNSTEIKGGNTAILSEVMKVIIHGNLGASSTGHEVIADYIVSVKAGPGASTALLLNPGPHNDIIAYESPIDPNSTTEFHEIGVRGT